MSARATAGRAPVLTVRRRLSASVTVAVESALLQIRAQWHPTNTISGIVQPVSFLLIAWFAGRSTGRVELEDAALGASLIALWGATVWSAGAILRAERWQGTLSQILARPTGLGTVLLGKTLGATLRSGLFIGGSVTATAAILGHAISIERPLPFVIALVAVLVSALVLGFLLSSLFVLTRAAGRISEALLYPIFILGGMLVPVSLLPGWVQPLSTVVSLRWGGELMTAAAHGDPQRASAWLMLVATTAAYGVLARLSFERVLVRARREGALDLY